MYRMSSKASSLPHEAAFLWQQARHLTTHQLIADRLVRVSIQLAGIAHLPRPAGTTVVITHASTLRGELGLLGVESVAISVAFTTDLAFTLHRVDLKDSVRWTVNVGVEAETEKVLVVVRVYTRVDFRAPWRGRLAWVQRVSVQDTGKLDLELNCAVLVEDPVNAVLVIGCREDVADNEFSCSGDRARLIAEVGVLEQYSCVLFVDANRILDRLRISGTIYESSVHVVDRTANSKGFNQ